MEGAAERKFCAVFFEQEARNNSGRLRNAGRILRALLQTSVNRAIRSHYNFR